MNYKKNKQIQKQEIKIISGNFRNRKINFIDDCTLRPTGARIRETLFNWLQEHIYSSKCLDLFAGSGILGFESLSRGAKHVTFIDKNEKTIKYIHDNCKKLKIDITNKVDILQTDYKKALIGEFDIVFIDPPYALDILPHILKNNNLKTKYIFIEDNKPFEKWINSIEKYKIIKSKKAGAVYYGLLENK